MNIQSIGLPEIPNQKVYIDNTTREQEIMLKRINGQPYSDVDIQDFNVCLGFYEVVFNKLKEIELDSLSQESEVQLLDYLKSVFNYTYKISNYVQFEEVFRTSIVSESFIEKGKVRNPKYLTHPPLELVQDLRQYNRANTYGSAVFYAAFSPDVSVMETRPSMGSKIIVSVWKNYNNEKFNSYPIPSNGVVNESANRSNAALMGIEKKTDPYFFKHMQLTHGFLGSEFVKRVKSKRDQKSEYIFSAFFADQILHPAKEGDVRDATTDCIIYPSVAWNHKEENIAITPNAVKSYLKLDSATEYEVMDTMYDSNIKQGMMPAKLKLIRHSDWIEEDDIIWDDD